MTFLMNLTLGCGFEIHHGFGIFCCCTVVSVGNCVSPPARRQVKLFVTLKKDVNALPLPSKCPDSWIARHVGITALCNDILKPVRFSVHWRTCQ